MAITKINKKVYFYRDKRIKEGQIAGLDYENAYKGTIAYGILNAHNINKPTVKGGALKIKFVCMASHDIT